MTSLARRLAAEALGTAILAATVVGSGIMAEAMTGDRAVMLLANSLATGAMLVVLITTLDPISGAHFNPVVSLVFALRRDLTIRDAIAYVVMQAIGAIAGVVLAHAMFGLPLLQHSATVRSGSGQWLAEIVASFGLLATIIAGGRHRPDAVAGLVALYIGAAYWFTASTSFANPALTLARAFTQSFAGIRLADVAAFTMAQVAGALLAAIVMGWLLTPAQRQQADASPRR